MTSRTVEASPERKDNMDYFLIGLCIGFCIGLAVLQLVRKSSEKEDESDGVKEPKP